MLLYIPLFAYLCGVALDKTVAVGMPQEMYDEIKRLAKEEQRSIPGYIRFVLRNYMKKESAQSNTE